VFKDFQKELSDLIDSLLISIQNVCNLQQNERRSIESHQEATSNEETSTTKSLPLVEENLIQDNATVLHTIPKMDQYYSNLFDAFGLEKLNTKMKRITKSMVTLVYFAFIIG
jgi:hypothetical protein